MGKFESEKKNGVVHIEDTLMSNGHIWMPCGHDQDISDEALQSLACEIIQRGNEAVHLVGDRVCPECAQVWHNPRVAWYSFCPPAMWYNRFPQNKTVTTK